MRERTCRYKLQKVDWCEIIPRIRADTAYICIHIRPTRFWGSESKYGVDTFVFYCNNLIFNAPHTVFQATRDSAEQLIHCLQPGDKEMLKNPLVCLFILGISL